jgi:chromosome segregation protein
VHLKSIKLRGFKSFVDPVEVRLEPGVAVVVGPNGSGKSNISDAILWATGSLSPNELRAEKPDDVLFSGSAGRKPSDFCEVELVFDNESGSWPELPFSEVSVARRLHRGGEGQYLVNRAAVRRIDLVELLSDVGLGGGLRSVISQGSVETVLGAKPDERRALVEEAAGLGRFKLRRHRAELKLARVAIQVERARDLEDEVRKRLRPLALQATAAERAAKLGDEVARVEAAIATLDLARLGAHRDEAARRRAAELAARKEVDAKLEALLASRGRAEEELTDAAGSREAATAGLYRLRAGGERLALRRETAEAVAKRFRADLAAVPEAAPRAAADGPSPAQLARAADAAVRLSDDLAARVQLSRERLVALDQSLAEREGIPPAARALAESGERLALSLVAPDPGDERAVAAALGHRASAILTGDAAYALGLVKRVRAAGLGSVVVLVDRDPRELVRELKVVGVDELLTSSVPVVTPEGIGWDPARGELWFAGETAEAVLLELEARRRALAAEVEELAARAEEAADVAADAARAAENAAATIAVRRVHADPQVLRRLVAAADRLVACLTADLAWFEAPLRQVVDKGAARASELGADLRRLGAEEVDLRRAALEATERLSAIDVDLARTGAEHDEAKRRLEVAGAEPAEGDDPAQLAERLTRLERRREQLGAVNPLAKEEYEAEKERLDELSTQRADLERSLEELESLRRELTETVEQRFEETFAAVEKHFAEVVKTLFPGGEGRLHLTEAEDENEEGEPGIEVELRPAGKRVTRLSLLSGGEKALGALAFLFSLFLSRPSPFYLLDEVEAALDDTNIGRFTGLLRTYADRAQFIVVTHQKRTMEAADVLYGVTMGIEGVSQIASRRLPQDAQVAATA